MPISLAETQGVIEAPGGLTRLLLLDDVWTAPATSGVPSGGSVDPNAWINELSGIVEEMHDLLKRGGDHGNYIASLVEQHLEEADDALKRDAMGGVLAASGPRRSPVVCSATWRCL